MASGMAGTGLINARSTLRQPHRSTQWSRSVRSRRSRLDSDDVVKSKTATTSQGALPPYQKG